MDGALNWLWQGAIVALACVAMLRALSRSHARVRYAVCWAALLMVVTLPVLPSFSPMMGPVGILAADPSDAIISLPHAWWTSTFAIAALWAAWIAVCAIRFVSALAMLRRARIRSRVFPSRVEAILPHWNRVRAQGRRATLVLTDSVGAAALLGCGAPMIGVAPKLLDALDTEQLDRIVIHEWSHVQRRDDLGNLFQVLIHIVAGWHPAVWWIGRRLRIEREMASDEMTVATTGCAKSYAQCLMHISSLTSMPGITEPEPAVGVGSDLRTRIRRIVSPHPWIAPSWSRAIAAGIVSTLCVMSAGIGGMDLFDEASVAPVLTSVETSIIHTPRATPSVAQRAPSIVAAGESPLPPETPVTSSSTQGHDAIALSPTAPSPAPTVEKPPRPIPVFPLTTLPGASMVFSPPVTSAMTPHTQSPWAVAADSGVDLGRKSKHAGLATAGVFTRLAHRVSGSF